MILLFRKTKELPKNMPMYFYEMKRISDSLCFMDEKDIDSEDKLNMLNELVMNNYIVPVSWKYFLDFITNLPITFKKFLI